MMPFPIPLQPPNVITLQVPTEKTLFVGRPLENPYLIVVTPLTHVLEVRMETHTDRSESETTGVGNESDDTQ